MKMTGYRTALCAVVLGMAGASMAADHQEPEAWQEASVALPTGLNTEGLAVFVLEQRSTMQMGIDPATLSVGPDGVVRYVFVARSGSGALNALYEGVRCKTAEVKVYGRWDPKSASWRSSPGDAWQRLEPSGATRRALQMAQGGLCDGAAPNRSPRLILESLKNGRVDQMR